MRIYEIRPEPRPVPLSRRGGSAAIAPPVPPVFHLLFPPKYAREPLEEFEPELLKRRPLAAFVEAEGKPLFVNIPSIPSSEFFPIPTFTGGAQGPQLFIGGVLITNWNPAGAGSGGQACVITSQTIGRSTCTLDIWVPDQSYSPALGQVVVITELGATIFAGCIDTLVADREIGNVSGGTTQGLTWHVTALDKSSICDHRICTAATYASGNDVATTINAIVTNFLNGEGITTGGVPTDGSLGDLTSDLILNYGTVTDAFNQIATQSGTVWWIDQYGVLYFSAEDVLPAAPFQLDETTTGVDSASGGSSMSACQLTQTLSGAGVTTGYRNQQFVVSNLNILPGSGTGGSSGTSGSSGITETFDFANGQPGITSGYVGGVLKPIFFNTSLPISSVISITVNGVVQTFYEVSQNTGEQYMGGTDYVWFYNSVNTIAGSSGSNQGVTAQGVLAVPSGATIIIEYVPGTVNATNAAASQVGSALVPSEGTFGTCGSGIYQNVLQVKNISTQADLNAIAAAELSKSGGIPFVLHCYTNKPGLFVGQGVNGLFPKMGLGSSPFPLLITATTRTANSGVPLDQGSVFTTEVTAVSNLDPGNWITWFTNVIARGENPLPVLQYEEATFILAPSGSLTSGVVSVNPYIQGRTGLLCEIMAAAGNPPTGQDLQILILDGLTVIGTIVIPAGVSTLIDQLVPASDGIYVYAKDILGISVSYINITSGSPTNAANVTVKVRTQM